MKNKIRNAIEWILYKQVPAWLLIAIIIIWILI
jgi:hypothetical protein